MTKKTIKKCGAASLGCLLATALLTGNCFAGGYNYDARNPTGYQDAQGRQYENVTGVVTKSGNTRGPQGVFSDEYMLENYYDQIYDDSNYDAARDRMYGSR